MSDYVKLNYFFNLRNRAANRAVAGFTPTFARYQNVMNTLKRQFGNLRIVRETLHHQLKTLKRHSHKVTEIQKLEIICRKMTLLRNDTNHPQIEISIIYRRYYLYR